MNDNNENILRIKCHNLVKLVTNNYVFVCVRAQYYRAICKYWVNIQKTINNKYNYDNNNCNI